MNTETNLQRHGRELRESAERLRAEADHDPIRAAMTKAMQPTKAERAELEAAQAAVIEAEAAVNEAGLAVARAARGAEPTYDRSEPFSFFKKSSAAHKAAADASLPTLRIDLEDARSRLQQAIRRRNEVASRVHRARMARRAEVKLQSGPKADKPTSRGDRWQRAVEGRRAA